MWDTVKKIEPFLKSFAVKLTGNTQDASDLFQDTILKCLEVNDRYINLHPKQKEQILKTTMYNTFCSDLKNKKRRTIITDFSDYLLADAPKNDFDNKVYLRIILNLKHKLEVKCALLYYSGYSMIEISTITNRHKAYVSILIKKGAAVLRKQLSQADNFIQTPPKPETKKYTIRQLAYIVDNSFYFYQKAS